MAKVLVYSEGSALALFEEIEEYFAAYAKSDECPKDHDLWKPFSKRQSLGFLGIFHARIDDVLIVIINFKLDILKRHYFFTPEHFSFFESDDLFFPPTLFKITPCPGDFSSIRAMRGDEWVTNGFIKT